MRSKQTDILYLMIIDLYFDGIEPKGLSINNLHINNINNMVIFFEWYDYDIINDETIICYGVLEVEPK